MKKFSLVVALIAFTFPTHAANISSVWRNVSGTWTNAANWTNFPLTVNFPDNGNGGFTYDATVGGGTVTVDKDIVILKFTQTAGTIGGNFTLTANELYRWLGGSSNRSGTNVANGGLEIRGNVTMAPGNLRSTVSAIQSNGNVTGGFGGFLINAAGATYTVQDDSDLLQTGSAVDPTFVNDGTFIKSGGTNVTTISYIFNNSGTVRGEIGSINLTFAGASSGVFTTAPAGRIQFLGNHTLNGCTLSGGGTIVWDTGGVGSLVLTNTINSSVALLTQTGGSVGGPGNLNHSGLFVWSTGIQTGTGTNTFTGPLIISNGSASLLGGRRLVPLGSTTLTNGSLVGGNGSVLSNAAGRTFTIVDDSDVTENGSAVHPIFDNVGLLQKTGGTNVSIMSFDLNNSGEVRVQSGTFQISNPGVNTGILTTAPNARILINSAYTLNGGTISGGGTFQFDNFNTGTIILTNTVTSRIATFLHTRGVYSGPGRLTHSGHFIWNGGSATGAGTNSFDGTFVIGGSVFLGPRTLVVNGSGIQSNGIVTLEPGTVITNSPTGVYDLRDDSSIINSGTAGPRWLHNAGHLLKSGSGNNISSLGAGISEVRQILTNSGTVTAQSGNLRFTAGYVQSGGATRVNGGTLTSTTGTLTINGGKVMGTGVINGSLINNGQITPGFSAGSLTVNGNVTNLAAASYFAELGGYLQGINYDVTIVTGRVTFAGNLITRFINNYQFVGTVTNGASFTILTSSNTLLGAFANVAHGATLRSQDGYANFTVTHAGSQNLVLSGLTILDDDSDGIANWWMDQHFGHLTALAGDLSRPDDDPDGDGFTNRQEYEAGTSPVSANSGLRITAITNEGTNTRVTWQTAGGRTNQLQVTNGGAGGAFTNNFTNLGAPTILPNPGSGDTITNQLDIGGATNVPARYYRVRKVP